MSPDDVPTVRFKYFPCHCGGRNRSCPDCLGLGDILVLVRRSP